MAKKTSIELYSRLVNELRSEDRKPIYFFYGEEEFFLDKLQQVVEGLVPDDQKDFNFDLLYGRDISPEKLLSIIRSYPMMADQRVVILSGLMNTPMTMGGRSTICFRTCRTPIPQRFWYVLIPRNLPAGQKLVKHLKRVITLVSMSLRKFRITGFRIGL